MAKTLEQLLIKLKVGGLEEVKQLRGSFRSLQKATNVSSKELDNIRKATLSYGKAGKQNIQMLQGQIDALNGLKRQATIGSTVYKKLATDIDKLSASLDSLNKREEEVAKKRSNKQIFNEGVATAPEKFTRQLAAGNEILQGLSITTSKYGEQLAKITKRTDEFSRAQQRQQVIAQNLAAMNRTQTTGFMQSSKVNIENVYTVSALKQKISELSADIENITVGTAEYTQTSRLLKDTQEELNLVLGNTSRAYDSLTQAQARSERRAKKLADIQQYYGTSRTGEGQAAQRQGGFRDPETGAMIARGTRAGRASLVQQPVREISSLYRSIGDIGMSGISADIDRMGNSYKEVANDIKRATVASNGSINSLQAQRSAWASLQAGLDPTSAAYRRVGREIEQVDARLQGLNRRRRLTVGGAASMLGGIAAGGVFGGPEGALGGAIGGAFGGVAGVAAGAAIGAQVKMMREAIGATATYSAQLAKLKISLEGTTNAVDANGTTYNQYQAALRAASKATEELNVPQEVAIKGMTRLSAAVIGAGGHVGDAEVVFRNVTAAVKATGGSAQDVDSALTAMVQTFSKGRVSAEELSGQLGERLPGAVTKFAEANKMTAPELQKALKAGTVGLDELMNFILSLGEEYSEVAEKIAESSQDAGARSTVAFNKMRIAIGEAVEPIGADLQNTFSEFITQNIPAIVAASKAVVTALNAMMKGVTIVVEKFKEFQKEIQDVAVVLGVAGLGAIIVEFVRNAALLGTQLTKLKGLIAGLALLNPWVLLATGIAAATVAIVKYNRRHAEFNKEVLSGNKTMIEAQAKLDKMNERVQEIQDRIDKESNNRLIKSLRKQLKLATQEARDLQLAMNIVAPYSVAGVKYDPTTRRPEGAPTGGYSIIDGKMVPHEDQKLDLTTFGGLKPEGGEGGAAGSRRMTEEELILIKAIGEARREGNEFLRIKKSLELELLQIQLDQIDGFERQAGIYKANLEADMSRADIIKKMQDDFKKNIDTITKSLDGQNEKLQEELNTRKQVERLIAEGINPELAKQLVQIDQIAAKEQESLNKVIAGIEKQLESATLEQEIRDVLQEQLDIIIRIKEERGEVVKAAKEAAAELNKEETFLEGLQGSIDETEKRLKDLIDPLNQVTSAAQALGDAFGESFKGIIDGAMTGKEALANFFQSIADYFSKMAAEIAAEAIKLAALEFVKFIISSIASGGGGGGGGGTKPPLPGSIDTIAANGMAFNENKIVPYAMGGVVKNPTLFQFANGGAGRLGLMGEAGPEAILPLKRGADGKLGVVAQGGGVGNIVVNVDAKGTTTEGNGPNANMLGKLIGNAVQAELVKQRRPGGLLA